MKLFDNDKVKKFFTILNRMDRGYSIEKEKQIYKGYDEKNPHIVKCQKEVFVNRTVNKWLKDKFIKLYKEDEFTKIEYIQYISILKIEFLLGWNDVLNIIILDYTQPYNFFNNNLRISLYDALRIEGEWSNGKTHSEIYNLIKLNLEEKEFIFNAYDWGLFLKRRNKNWTEDKMKIKFPILAKTEKEAIKKANKYCQENKLILIN